MLINRHRVTIFSILRKMSDKTLKLQVGDFAVAPCEALNNSPEMRCGGILGCIYTKLCRHLDINTKTCHYNLVEIIQTPTTKPHLTIRGFYLFSLGDEEQGV